MTALDLRERQYQLFGWSVSVTFMLVLWLLLGQFAIDRPRQEQLPNEAMLNWVRTIVPTPTRDRVIRQRDRERAVRSIPRAVPQPLSQEDRSAVERDLPRLRQERSLNQERRGAGSLPDLPGRDTASRVHLPDRSGRVAGGLETPVEGMRRGSSSIEINAGPGSGASRRQPSGGQGAMDRIRAFPAQSIDRVLAGFLGCSADALPGTQLQIEGSTWRVWFCEQGGMVRALLQQGSTLHVLALAGADLQLQSYQQGTSTETSAGLVVQAARTRTGDGAGLRRNLLEALEERQ